MAKALDLNPKVEAFLKSEKQLFINGQFVNSADGKTFETVNPATGEKIATVHEAGKEDVNKAVNAAREAFDHGPWSKISAAERSHLIYKLADKMEENHDELGQLGRRDPGNPISEARGAGVALAIARSRYFAGWSTKLVGPAIPVQGAFFTYSRHEPTGVVGQIIPWNF